MKIHVLAGMALVAVGCASHPAPTDQIASSLAAVRGAEEAGARDVPEAALHVKLAEEQIAQAKRLMEDDEDNRRAEDLAIRAYQDAELALALARENAAKRRVEEFASSSGSAGGEAPMPPSNNPSTTMPTPGTATP